MLHAPFSDRSAFAPNPAYRLLPFRFTRLRGDEYILTNEVGEYMVLRRDDLVAVVHRMLDVNTEVYRELKAKHFVFDEESRVALDLLAVKYRTRAETLASFTGLHIFVVTLRCDHSCQYCQVSRQTEDTTNFDMTKRHADVALSHVFRSPASHLKIEFQGGEPLLNFELVRYVVERAVDMNKSHGRCLQFVIASNLSRLSDDILAFCKLHGIILSTSLDGPHDLHNTQRPVRGRQSYEMTIDAIRRARAVLGEAAVAALMTTTSTSLERIDEIIDEYVRQGFHSIFLRSISPYGFAVRNTLVRRQYTTDDWVAFYKRGLRRIIDLNQGGYRLREEYTSILLQKMFCPTGANYVDLQSPAGIGIGALVYNYDGAVYASDEGRMLAEMGDYSFRLGHLENDSYESMMCSETLLAPLMESMPEGAPMCSDCAFLPYCGADPVFHTATQRDPVGHKAFSAFCGKQMATLRHLIGLLEDDTAARDVLLSWV